MLDVSGNSSVDIRRVLIASATRPSRVNIINNLCPPGTCVTLEGVRVKLNGTPQGNVTIFPNAITPGGTVHLSADAAHLQVSGAGSRVTIGCPGTAC